MSVKKTQQNIETTGMCTKPNPCTTSTGFSQNRLQPCVCLPAADTEKERQHSSSKDAKNQLLSSSFFGEFDYLTDKTDDEFWRQSFQSVHHSDTFLLNLFWGNKTNSRFVEVEREDPSCRCMNSFATGRLSYIAD